MSTMTVPQAQTGLMAQAKSWAALVRAYALRMGHNAIALVRQGREIASSWWTRLLAYIPKTVLVGAGAAWLATKKGYHATVNAGAWLLHKAGSAITWAARFAHKAFIWTASRACDLVGMVSPKAGAKAEEILGTVNCYLLRTARQVGFVSNVALELGRTVLLSPTVTLATNIAAGAVLVGAILSLAAPGALGFLATIPILSSFVGSGAAGSFAAFKLIGLVTAAASVIEIGTEVFHTDDRVSVAKGFVSDVKAAGDPDVTPMAAAVDEARTEPEMAMATVKATPDADLAKAQDQAKAEADTAFAEAKSIHGSSQNKSHKRR
jgi:hypothetical protein